MVGQKELRAIVAAILSTRNDDNGGIDSYIEEADTLIERARKYKRRPKPNPEQQKKLDDFLDRKR